MNRFEIRGDFNRIETFTTSTGKAIISIILDVPDGKYPQVVAIKCLGRTEEIARRLMPGSTVEVTGKLGGRDWKGRVFGDLIANTIECTGTPTAKAPEQSELPGTAEKDDDAPPF